MSYLRTYIDNNVQIVLIMYTQTVEPPHKGKHIGITLCNCQTTTSKFTNSSNQIAMTFIVTVRVVSQVLETPGVGPKQKAT